MILTNAVIWTGDPGLPWAESIAVRGTKILAVGQGQAVRQAVPDGQIIDMQGAFITPGLIDAHAHVLGFGHSLERVGLVGATSLEETLSRVAVRVGQSQAEERSGWILGRGWDQNDWPVQDFPTRYDLDTVSGDYPVSLGRIDGHALWVNSKALELAGVTRDTPDPPGGKIHRDASGEPTGILVDEAESLVSDVVPSTNPADKALAIRRATSTLIRSGLTGIHDMGMTWEEASIYRELADADQLGLRIYGALSATDSLLEKGLAAMADRTWRSGTFKLGMVKFYVDGALGSRGAALLAPYTDDPENRGLLIIGEDSLRVGMRQALEANYQCAVHAIGDRANRTVLDVWESLYRDYTAPWAVPSTNFTPGNRGSQLPKVRIEHAQIIDLDDLDRFATLNVVASMQPTHCTSDMPWAPRRLGSERRLAGSYAWRTLVDKGVVFVGGSDFPVESHDPLLGLYAAVTRRGIDGSPTDGWSPSERLGREEALASFTSAPAYASGDLHQFGTLSPGKLADFAVFDRNLVTCDPERLLDAACQATVIGGRLAWLNETASFASAMQILGGTRR